MANQPGDTCSTCGNGELTLTNPRPQRKLDKDKSKPGKPVFTSVTMYDMVCSNSECEYDSSYTEA